MWEISSPFKEPLEVGPVFHIEGRAVVALVVHGCDLDLGLLSSLFGLLIGDPEYDEISDLRGALLPTSGVWAAVHFYVLSIASTQSTAASGFTLRVSS